MSRETVILGIALIGLGIGVVFTEGRIHTTLFLFWLTLLPITFAAAIGMFSD